MSRFNEKDYYFRVKYKKLETTNCKLSNLIRCDLKFECDADKRWVFALYPDFETLSEDNIVGDEWEAEWEALDEGTAMICKPIYEDRNGYFNMIRERVKVGEKAYFVGGSHKIAELEIIEIINEI